MRWRRCPCGCGRLIGNDERYCRQRGEGYRAFAFEDWLGRATPQERAFFGILTALLELEPEGAIT